jgi:hypothetical protein
MPLPPLRNTIEALQQDVLPGVAGAAFVMCLFLLLGRRAGAVGSAAAVTFAFIWANFTIEDTTFDKETGKLVWEKAHRLAPWKADPDAFSAYHALIRAALLLLILGLISRGIGFVTSLGLSESRRWVANVLVWATRLVSVFVVSGWLLSERLSAGSPWLRSVIGIAMFMNWFILDSLAQARASADAAAIQGILFYAASVVLLYANSTLLMELAVVIGSAMFGLAVSSYLTSADVSGAFPATVVFLPGLTIGAQPSLTTEVPAICFWLLAFAPLALAPFLIPSLARRQGWQVRAMRAVAVSVPLIAAIVTTMQYEEFPFGKEELPAGENE